MIERVLNYIIALGLCLLFALFMSAETGWTLFWALAAAPLFSFILTAVTFFSKSLSFNVDASGSMVYKNEDFRLKISIKNKSIIPVPAIIIKTVDCEGVSCENNGEEYTVSVYTRGSAEFDVSCKAAMWGGAEVGIKEIYLCDFLHFIKIPLYKEKGEKKYTRTVRIFPDIPDVQADTPLVRTAAEQMKFNDDSEDTKETDGISFFGGMAGYTHREYVEGDPVKRINWKLSSRKDSYMVRLDDEAESMQQVIILDSKSGSRSENERAVEGVLAIVHSLFRLGFDATVWFNTKDGLICHEIKEQGDVPALQLKFAEYSFEENPPVRIPVDDLSEKSHSGIIIFTPCPDKMLTAEIEEAAGFDITAVSAAEKDIFLPAPYWLLDKDYTAEFIS